MNKIDFSNYEPQRIFLIQGDETVFDTLVAEAVVTNPLTQALSVPRLTIEHARSVAEFAIEGTGEERSYIIYFSVFSPEAAQILLKSLEEPAPHTTIIFITRYPYLVPQTVRSRMMLIHTLGERQKKEKKNILEQLKKEAESKDDDAATRRARALNVLDELEIAVADNAQSAQKIYEAKRMLFFANLPTKYVLDYMVTMIH